MSRRKLLDAEAVSERARPRRVRESRLAWALCAPALAVVLCMAIFPLAWTFWQSLLRNDLRLAREGARFVGVANYAEALTEPRFWEALAHTAGFTAVSVAIELALGLALALLLHRGSRGRGAARAAALVPWALPTVVAALVWRFLFEGRGSAANALLVLGGGEPVAWLADSALAWVPIVLADVWKTTPFVALLLLAGLQNIDPALVDAARVDGASAWQRLRFVTLPLLRPALVVALLFRGLDAFRVFDLVYALTAGGPGTATEPIALYTFTSLLRNLRFGYGSALSVIVFLVTFAFAWLYVRKVGSDLLEEPR